MRFVLSEAVREVEEWLDEYTYDYRITKVQKNGYKSYTFYIEEVSPNGEIDFYTLVCNSDGSLINDNGNDVTEVAQEAYDNDESILNWVKVFVDKWYVKED